MKLQRVLTRNDLRDYNLCLSNTHMLRLEKAGRFPKRVYLGEKTPVWLEEEILDWLKGRLAERGKTEPTRKNLK